MYERAALELKIARENRARAQFTFWLPQSTGRSILTISRIDSCLDGKDALICNTVSACLKSGSRGLVQGCRICEDMESAVVVRLAVPAEAVAFGRLRSRGRISLEL